MKGLVVVALLAGGPTAAAAQPAIAGLVRNPAGDVLAGVLVEARSPALIETTRSALTDGNGRYRIEDLRPGTYQVRFTLAGWTPFEQNGIELSGSLTATVNAQLGLPGLTDTITVTAETPIVDVRAAWNEVTLSGEVVKSVPTIRTYNALVGLIPGVVTNANDVVTATTTTSFPIHGGRTNEGRLLLDGLNVGSPPSGNSATSYVVDVGDAQEVTFAAGGLGEVETAGLLMNVIPKAGGNTTSGSFFASGTGERLQSNNLTPDLERQGLVATPLRKVYDFSGTLGGPIARSRAWYFVNAHTGGNTKPSANVHYNLNAGDPAKWLYMPDSTRREYSDRTFENASARLTWQVTPRNKLGAFWDAQALCRTCSGATPGLSEPPRVTPEAVGVLGRPLHVTQATWVSPVSNTLLVEAAFGGTYFGVGNFERTPNPTRDLIRVAEQCANGCALNGNIPGLVYRSQDFSVAHTGSYLWKGSASYVTGTHSLKIGYQHTFMTDDRTWMTNNQNLTYRLNNGQPNQLTQSISPWINNARAAWDGLFVQEQWIHDRVTLQGALRFDRARSWFPAQTEGPSRFLPTPILIAETRGVDSYKDITPRLGAAVDLFGSGRTALKINFGKYLEGVGISGNYANTNPSLRMPQTTGVFGTAGVTRSWLDANSNFAPDCDLMNPAAQDLRSSGGDLCGVMSNTSFGRNILTNAFDPAVLNGWGVRPSDWTLAVSLAHQIISRASVSLTYSRRSFHQFFAVDNLLLTAADFTTFSVTAPLDPRLPGGGGYRIDGLYDVVPEKAGQVSNLVTDSANYGRWAQYFNGIDAGFNVRADRFTIAAGVSTGQTVADNCNVRTHLPELSTTTTGTSTFGAGLNNSGVTPLSPYCHVAYGVLTQFKGLSSYLVPKIDLQLAATFQSRPGVMVAANYAIPNDVVAPSLGRNLSGDAQNVTVNLVPAGTMYGDRLNELDVRLAKVLRIGGPRSTIGLELYNALNSSAVLAHNTAYVPNGPWLQPMAVMTPRLFKFTLGIDF
ncbi:MAG TPA: TonB-dependent receptor [Vicinamibacterales bacterium]|nr:TonB-dependent receptor [Vicinamibacterales bacterium]